MLNYSVMQMFSFFIIKSDDYIDIFKKYDDYFSNFNIFADFLRWLGWMLLNGLIKLNSVMIIAVDKIFSFINFLDSEEVIQFFDSVKPLIWTVFLFALVYMAFCYLIAHEKPKGVFSNVLMFAITILALPYLMTQATQIVSYVKDALVISSDDSGYSLLAPYITDLVYLDSIDFDEEKIESGQLNGFTDANAENIKYIEINEIVDPSEFKLKNKGLFKRQLSSTIKDGVDTLEVTKIKKDKMLLKDVTPYYYRYHVNFVIAGIYLLALLLVLVFSSVKLGQLEYELVSEKIITPFIAAGDLTGGQKLRKALIGILNAYITLICILFLQTLFVLATEYINQTTWAENAAGNGAIKSILILSGALFVIDGPNFFEQIFGVDAGLKSVGQALQSAYYGSQMLGGLKRAASGAVHKAGDMAKGAAGKIAQTMGTLDGMKDTGVLNSNNEKVSSDMASGWYMGEVPIDPSHALEKQSDDHSGTPELPGGGQPLLTGGDGQNTIDSSSSTQQEGSTQQKSSPNSTNENVSNGLGGVGKQNLNNTTRKEKGRDSGEDINNAINDALNNTQSSNVENVQSEIKDNETLSGWLKKTAHNSSAGHYLQGNYAKGKDFGHALGNSINKRRQQRTNQLQNDMDKNFQPNSPQNNVPANSPQNNVPGIEKNNVPGIEKNDDKK